MTASEEVLEALLRAWGRVMGERPPVDDEDRPARAVHALARGMEFAPGKRSEVVRQRTTMHRAGQARRETLAIAANSGVRRGDVIRIVPATYVDPVPCIETRSHRNEARDWPVPPEVAQVDRAALDLQAMNDLRGRVLRVNYCTRGSREDKVLRLSSDLGRTVTMGQFKAELVFARVWMHARLTA